jgi:hypothetical protein
MNYKCGLASLLFLQLFVMAMAVYVWLESCPAGRLGKVTPRPQAYPMLYLWSSGMLDFDASWGEGDNLVGGCFHSTIISLLLLLSLIFIYNSLLFIVSCHFFDNVLLLRFWNYWVVGITLLALVQPVLILCTKLDLWNDPGLVQFSSRSWDI